MQFTEANGIRFAYLEQGDGPLVLLLHGFPDTAHTWDDAMPRIASKGYRAVAPFLRGYHPSDVPSKDTTIEALGHDAVAFIDVLGAGGPAIVVGHDWGAAAGYAAAVMAPEKLAKLIVIAVPHPATIRLSLAKLWRGRHLLANKLPGAAKRFAKDDFAALPMLYRRWSPTWSPAPEAFDAVRACYAHEASLNAAFAYYRALELTPPSCLRAKVSVDTVAFAGTDDPIMLPADYHRAKRMFTGEYTVEEMPGGHFLHREHPQIFAERLLRHL